MSLAPGLFEGVFVLAATVAALLSAARRLPVQNVLLAGAVMALGGVLTELAATRFGILTSVPDAGPRLFGILPWWFPCLWVAVLLPSRGSALYLLKSRKASARFGWEVMALTTGLALILRAAAGYDARRHGYWTAPPAELPVSLGVCAVGIAFILLITTPILINKKPAPIQPDYHPLILWLLLIAFLFTQDLR